MYKALLSGKMKGAALYVLKNEPPKESSRKLLSLPNVIVTPHVACNDEETIKKMGIQAINNIKYFFEGDSRNVNKFIN